MVEGLAHVLIHIIVGGIENGSLIVVKVQQEAVFGHVLLLFGCEDGQRANARDQHGHFPTEQ